MKKALEEKNIIMPTITEHMRKGKLQYTCMIPASKSRNGKRHQITGKTREECEKKWAAEMYDIEENGKDRKQVKRNSARSILCIETGKVYSSCAEASRDIGVSASHITEVLKGVHNTCGGYHWEYSDDLSCFKNAFRCKELQTIYLSFKQALDEDGFNSNKLSARLKEKSPCIYAGYTFEWVNPQFHK